MAVGRRPSARSRDEKSLALLKNDGTLPLTAPTRLAVVGPRADDALVMMGCYSFPSHVLAHHPEVPLGLEVPTVLEALRAEFPAVQVPFAQGCDVRLPGAEGIADAVAAARDAEVVVVALGDQAGLFGRGTSGEGCEAEDLELPHVQGELLDALLGTGTPVVLVMLAGRPYALGRYADRCAAVVQGFFPGEEGGAALAGILSGRVAPTDRLPLGIPRTSASQPGTYLSPPLGLANEVSNLDPTPLWPFGFGLSYTEFSWTGLEVDGTVAGGPVEVATDGSVRISLTVTNTGASAGAEVVQVYVHDPVAQVTRPVMRLVGYARVELAAGESRRVTLDVSADLTSFTGIDGSRIVEPGDIELRLSTSSSDVRETVHVRLTGPLRRVDHTRVLTTAVEVS